ncbi:peptidase M20 domain-containing protein 2 [Geobacter sp. OR-1]|uniref:M20 family metallopeptidase n=1 Tax=Geobacter sp. OR-1 TaxID=1266765 RepID=UPI0005425F99|nr:M20 family metallopeptidase [Geobacter sp. OR-1]GAM11214.1 peptidase M20 domain-containing protein 2 [Geobacter sp. OR-1]
MDVASLKDAVVKVIRSREQDFIAISHELFKHPETGLQEHRSSELLCKFLKREGFRVQYGLAGMETAFMASRGDTGPSIAILAEMDALPELGHACGHNIIAAAALGAATGLRAVLSNEDIRLTVLGTPAEEQGIGKIELIKAGYFDRIDFAMMVHPSSRRYITKAYLGLARLKFIFFGRPAHASAYPEEGINALDAVIQTFNAINALRQQTAQDVRIHGIITEGGTAPNIIPARAACSFYVRAMDLDRVHQTVKRVIACAQGAATAAGCEVEVVEDPRIMAPFRINAAFSELYAIQLQALGLQVDEVPVDRNCGSSDIGNVSQIVPTIHPHVPIGLGINIHSNTFAEASVSPKGDQAVLEGACALAMAAVELACDPECRQRITEEFRNS